jgi:bacillithiol biosynthesis cysteine-adding enzyme BshC
MQMIELAKANAGANLRIESLPFDRVPGQSKLFLQYQSDPLSLRRFYPSAVSDPAQLSNRVPEVLENYRVDRNVLCDILAEQNRRFGAGEKAFANIDRLRADDVVAVLTGQQAGLFGGPLYTIYKAMSAIRLAEELTANGCPAVPVFWAATEDHDLDEIAYAEVIGVNGDVHKVSAGVRPRHDGLPVGNIEFDASIERTIDELFLELPVTEFTTGVHRQIAEAYREGETFGTSFAGFIAGTFSAYGLVVIDPLDARLKQLASPIYVRAAEKADAIVEAVQKRDKELAEAGFHSQVLVEANYYPMFWHDADGVRRSLKRNGDQLVVTGAREEIDRSAIVSAAEDQPERLSPGVMLRPVVQDYLLPTLCYFGGAAEIAYFAQNREVYRVLERPVTPILHRQSFTVVEAKHQRILHRFGLTFEAMFAGLEKLVPQIVEKYLDPETAKTIADVEETINRELNRLDGAFSRIDPTLAANLATRRRKILYHISALYKKFQAAQLRKDETAERQLHAAFAALFPYAALQERSISLASFTDRYGENFIDWIYNSVDLTDNGHRVLYF